MKVISRQVIQTPSGLELQRIRIPAEEGRKLILKLHGQMLEKYSNHICQNYYYQLADNSIVNVAGWEPDDTEMPNIPGLEAIIYRPYEAFLDHIEEAVIQKKIISSLPKKNKFRLPNGHTIEIEVITGEELEKKRNCAIIIEKPYYPLSNGKILKDNHITGEIFSNQHEFEMYQSYLKKYYKYVKLKSMGEFKGLLTWNLNGINKYDEDTLEHIEEFSSRLPDLLNAPEYIFDYTINNLFKVDKHLFKHIITNEFKEKVFLPLLAYVGQTYVKNNGGNWVLLYDELNQLWLPDVRQADGEMKMLYHPISIILNPVEGKGSYLALKSVYLHKESQPA